MHASKRWKELTEAEKKPHLMQYERLKMEYEAFLIESSEYKQKVREI